ncbi:uncharacterized protein LOC114785451 [Denticeps clupeoides]|uniref:uncharacterized protein LOC114785451 n=1 Tax=Denticeps clupeoides TaxID=299321 RepID=UPI0010A39D8C|nr:uncharacterized protein LOC114785451 [Denticeps clupeoides]
MSLGDAEVQVPRQQQQQQRRGPRRLLSVAAAALSASALCGAVVLALGAWQVHGVRDRVERLEGQLEELRGPGPAHVQMQSASTSSYENYAYLKLQTASLMDQTMPWVEFQRGPDRSVGGNFRYDGDMRVLTVRRSGLYFLHVALNFTCVGGCSAAAVSVTFTSDRQVLDCRVDLPPGAASGPVTHTCWTLLKHMDAGGRLISNMSVKRAAPEGTMLGWRLVEERCEFGIFLMERKD